MAKIEQKDRRIDLLEYAAYCIALGIENMDDGIAGRGFFLWADKSSFDSGKMDKLGNPIMTPYSFNGTYDFLLLGK